MGGGAVVACACAPPAGAWGTKGAGQCFGCVVDRCVMRDPPRRAREMGQATARVRRRRGTALGLWGLLCTSTRALRAKDAVLRSPRPAPHTCRAVMVKERRHCGRGGGGTKSPSHSRSPAGGAAQRHAHAAYRTIMHPSSRRQCPAGAAQRGSSSSAGPPRAPLPGGPAPLPRCARRRRIISGPLAPGAFLLRTETANPARKFGPKPGLKPGL